MKKTTYYLAIDFGASSGRHILGHLENGEMKLEETAHRCGYPHKSYFCQVFKKYTGMSPGEYHQSVRDQ